MMYILLLSLPNLAKWDIVKKTDRSYLVVNENVSTALKMHRNKHHFFSDRLPFFFLFFPPPSGDGTGLSSHNVDVNQSDVFFLSGAGKCFSTRVWKTPLEKQMNDDSIFVQLTVPYLALLPAQYKD